MRPRREAKPPRRPPRGTRQPRVITWRLVIVSLVVGVVLAVVSVPVGVMVSWRLGPSMIRLESFVDTSTQTFLTMTSSPGETMWIAQHKGYDVAELAQEPDVSVVERDPRPRAARVPADDDVRSTLHTSAGWPFRAGQARSIDRRANARARRSASNVDTVGIWRPVIGGQTRPIPCLPLWPGLLGNTLFYGVLALTPIALLRYRRLRRRARRGLCLACGYELGEGVDACPECGLARAVS